MQEHHPGFTIEDARTLWKSGVRSVRVALTQVVPSFVKLLADEAPLSQEDRAETALELTALLLQMVDPGPDPTPSTPPSPSA